MICKHKQQVNQPPPPKNNSEFGWINGNLDIVQVTQLKYFQLYQVGMHKTYRSSGLEVCEVLRKSI